MIIEYLRKYLTFYPSLFKIRIGTRRVRAKAIGKKEILDWKIEQELQESRQRWRRDADVIRRIIELEKELGHPPTLLDLYCRFERAEIDAISDYLPWLLTTTTNDDDGTPDSSTDIHGGRGLEI